MSQASVMIERILLLWTLRPRQLEKQNTYRKIVLHICPKQQAPGSIVPCVHPQCVLHEDL